jgi:predicted glycoside hydrolase/deacetylase ChbG (UPF0249 family)
MGSSKRYLIVNADDYGRSPGVSAGIRESHVRGIVTSTTAMMNMPGIDDELRLAVQDCPNLGLGVHLTLTAGKPILSPEAIPSLVAEAGAFPRLRGFIARLSMVEADEAQAEWRAQIEKFIEATGRSPDHLDSHHHCSYLTHWLFEAMLELACEYGCAIRSPFSKHAIEIVEGLPGDCQRRILAFGPTLLQKYRSPSPDHFIASFYGVTATKAGLLHIIDTLPEGVTEIMCHPGYVDAPLREASGYVEPRQDELAVLADPGVGEHLSTSGIVRYTFEQLQGVS